MARAVPDERLTISVVSSTWDPDPHDPVVGASVRLPAPVRTRGKHRRYSVHEVDLLRQLRDEITAAIRRGRRSRWC
jgi:hypothetical protein